MPLEGNNERLMMMLKFQLDTSSYSSLASYMDALKMLTTEAEVRVEKLENLLIAIDATVFSDTANPDDHVEIMAYVHECVELWKTEIPEMTIVQ